MDIMIYRKMAGKKYKIEIQSEFTFHCFNHFFADVLVAY